MKLSKRVRRTLRKNRARVTGEALKEIRRTSPFRTRLKIAWKLLFGSFR